MSRTFEGTACRKEPLTASQVKKLVQNVKDSVKLLADADPVAKAALYADLGIQMTYHPDRHVVVVEADVEGPPARVPKSVSEGGFSL